MENQSDELIGILQTTKYVDKLYQFMFAELHANETQISRALKVALARAYRIGFNDGRNVK